MNVVIIRGTLSRDPEHRTLPSGDQLGQFEVSVVSPDRPTASVPVAMFDPPNRVLALAAGTGVVVTGEIRRRFFRTPAGTGSRTELVATTVVPTSRAKKAAAAVEAAIAQITGD